MDNEELILRVNEIYHDVEEKEYENRHPEIFVFEAGRWQKFGEDYLKTNKNNLSILDIGTGTGFIPSNIAGFLKTGDLFILSDISSGILEICRENISRQNFNNDFKFLKITGQIFDLPGQSLDAVVLNSVLHHLPSLEKFFSECNRLLKPGGLLVIGHEPNRNFYKNNVLWNFFIFLNVLFNPKKTVTAIFKAIGLYKLIRPLYLRLNKQSQMHEKIVSTVNRHLLDENIIKKELSADEISDLVDFHTSPAGGDKRGGGIDIKEQISKNLPNFKILKFEIYNHLSEISEKNWLTKKLDNFFKNKYPEDGETFFIILEKLS